MIKLIPPLLLSVASFAQPAVLRFTNSHAFDTRLRITQTQSASSVVLIYWNDISSSRYFETPPGKQLQPITLVPEQRAGVLCHYLNHFDKMDFPVFSGDTLTVTYTPTGMSVTDQNGMTYPDVFAGDHSMEGYSASGVYHKSLSMLRKRVTLAYPNWSALTTDEREKIKRRELVRLRQELYLFLKKQLRVAEQRNDSLQGSNRISAALFAYNRDKIRQISREADFDAGLVSDSTVYHWMDSHTPWQIGCHDYYYERFRDAVLDEKISSQVSILADGKTYAYPDSPKIFDLIASSSAFPPKDRNALLARELGRIRANFSRRQVQTYFAKFSRLVADTALVKEMREEFSSSLNPEAISSNSLLLRNAAGAKTSLTEVLSRHKGKIIYVDFWASWCAPCRKALPASTALRSQLTGIVFVYLSLDDSPAKWQKALTQEALDKYPDSYLVLSAEASAFIKQQKVGAIPRYMIFDKKGKLAYAAASGADSPDTGPLLQKLAKAP